MASYTEEDNKVKMSQEERDKLMKEFLEKGGKIKELKPGIAKGAASMNRSKGLQWTENSCYRQVIFRPEKRGMFWLARSQWGWKIYYF